MLHEAVESDEAIPSTGYQKVRCRGHCMLLGWLCVNQSLFYFPYIKTVVRAIRLALGRLPPRYLGS
jgi:hypothetical protein